MKNFFYFAVLLFIFFTTTTTFAQQTMERNKSFFLQAGRGIFGESVYKSLLEYKKVEGSPTFHGTESSAVSFGYYLDVPFEVVAEYGNLGSFSIQGSKGDTFALGSDKYTFAKNGKFKEAATYFGIIINSHYRENNFDFFAGMGLARVNRKITYSDDLFLQKGILEKGTISKLGKSGSYFDVLGHVGAGYHIYDFLLYVGIGNGGADLFGLHYSFY